MVSIVFRRRLLRPVVTDAAEKLLHYHIRGMSIETLGLALLPSRRKGFPPPRAIRPRKRFASGVDRAASRAALRNRLLSFMTIVNQKLSIDRQKYRV
jgi:hypothetical protein